MAETLKMALHIIPAILPSTILVYLFFLPLSLGKLLENAQDHRIISSPFLRNTSFVDDVRRKTSKPKRTRAILYLVISSACYGYFLSSKAISNEEVFATVRNVSLPTLKWSFEIALLLIIFGVVLSTTAETSDGIRLSDVFWVYYIDLVLFAIRIVQLVIVTIVCNWTVMRYLAWFPL